MEGREEVYTKRLVYETLLGLSINTHGLLPLSSGLHFLLSDL
jgi:hypothetical protein